jgi:hypothetical protein
MALLGDPVRGRLPKISVAIGAGHRRAEQSLVRARQRVCHEFGDRKFLEGLHYFVVHDITWAGSSGEIRALGKCVEAVTFNAANKPPASPA